MRSLTLIESMALDSARMHYHASGIAYAEAWEIITALRRLSLLQGIESKWARSALLAHFCKP